ncbi:MAG TPA: hypothetical protein VK867_08420, partial [Candidatus Limnocylindrales bacterium]|nr:hypothetical protein [Candidatus Limnocylindrales bacterium]
RSGLMARDAEKDEGLRRLGGGRWQTRDERFTIEPQSGTWAVVDAEQTDDLGLPLVRGPFKSLAAAKEVIAAARDEAAPASPLKDRAPAAVDDEAKEPRPTGSKAAKDAGAAKEPEEPEQPKEPEEPRWFRDLEPDDRRRAARLIQRLTEAGASDAEGIVRRDLVGEVPAIAAFAIARAVRELGSDPSVAEIVELLNDGRDAGLSVRWRLVDGDGRPVRLDPDELDAG